MPESELTQLVERALSGDEQAFSRLFEHHQRLGATVAYSVLRDPHLASDAVQDAFLRAFERLASLKEPTRFVAWLMTIVRSCALDLLRRKQRAGGKLVTYGDFDEADADAGLGRTSDGSQNDSLERDEEAAQLQRALAELPEEYREVILLKHVEGRNYRDMSRILKISVKAVESRLFRARQQLQRRLEIGGDE